MKTTISRWKEKYSTMCGSTSKKPNHLTGALKTKNRMLSLSNNMAQSSIRSTNLQLETKVFNCKTMLRSSNQNPKRRFHQSNRIQDHLRVGLVMFLMDCRLIKQTTLIRYSHRNSILMSINLQRPSSRRIALILDLNKHNQHKCNSRINHLIQMIC